MKKQLILFAICLTSFCVSAQDIIVTKDAQKIDAKILEVSETEIRYKEFDNLDGPTFVLSTDKLSSIIYSKDKVILYNKPIEQEVVASTGSQSKEERTSFVGAVGTTGVGIRLDDDISVNAKYGMDFAWYTSDKFAIGFYFAFGMGIGSNVSREISWDLRAGLLMLFGNKEESPFLFGITPGIGFAWGSEDYIGLTPIEFRLGRIINNSMYISFNLCTYPWLDVCFEPSISFGFPLDKKQKK